MSSDMKKRTLSGRLRLAMAGDLAVAAGFGGAAFCAADGRAVARAAPAALVRKLRRVVVFVFRLLIEGPQELRYKSTTERKPRWRAALSGGLEGSSTGAGWWSVREFHLRCREPCRRSADAARAFRAGEANRRRC